MAAALREAGPLEVPIAVAYLSGELPQRQIGVGWAALRSLPAPAAVAVLSVAEVHAAFTAIGGASGPGSQALRAGRLAAVFSAATVDEQLFLRRLLGGELRQGALLGVMTEGVARVAGLPVAAVRRAAMLGGNLPAVAAAAMTGGAAALAEFRLQVGRPVGPMLAQTAASVEDALARLGGEALFETKLDGARVQIHRSGADVAIYTRTLDDITERLPEVVEFVRALAVDTLVADGEVIALRPDGRPYPFQVTASRFGRRVDIATARESQPVRAFLFDVMHLDGRDLLDEPTSTRLGALDSIVPAEARVQRLTTADATAARAFFDATLAAGHEGVMAKSLTAAYEAGRRGAGWLKVKPVHTLDLVVLAVEWGSGRRKGRLSNIHLGARDPETGGFLMLGKTFKGMTDAMLEWQTARFTELASGGPPAGEDGGAPTNEGVARGGVAGGGGPIDGYVVTVRPEQVVEIAFDGLQASSRYPAGLALRFARVVRYRDDKRAEEADTIDAVRALYVG
ncbi:MAG: ATP-dependent DNA ligase [Jatrophihabitantaceae bacterium]